MENPSELRSTAFLPLVLFIGLSVFGCQGKKNGVALPKEYAVGGAFIKTLPYFNPDSCAMLIHRDVPKQWQGSAYENLFMDGPEDSPLELGFRHLALYEKSFPADTATAFAQIWRGHLYTLSNKLDSARTCFQASYAAAVRQNHPLREGDAQEALAHLYVKEGKTVEALAASLAHYEAVKNLGPDEADRILTAMRGVASTYHQSGNDRLAIDWVQRSLPYLEDEAVEKNRPAKVEYFRSLGTLYLSLGLPDSAILMTQMALDLREKYRLPNGRSPLLRNLGAALLKKGDCRAALRHFNEALNLVPASNRMSEAALSLDLAKAHNCLGRLDSAEIFANRALQAAQPTVLANAYDELAEILAKRGNFRSAYDRARAGKDFGKKVLNAEKLLEMGGIKAQHQLDMAQKDLAILESKHRSEQLQKLAIALFALLSLGFSVVLYMRQRAKSHDLEQQNLILEQTQMLKNKEIEIAQARERIAAQESRTAKAELVRSEDNLKTTKLELEYTAAQLLSLKNSFIEELEMRVAQNHSAPDKLAAPDTGSNIGELRSMKILTDRDWAKFRSRFEEHFPGYLDALKTELAALTAAETRLFLLLKLGFDNREISETLGISQDSVWRNRARLRVKLGLTETGELNDFIRQFFSGGA